MPKEPSIVEQAYWESVKQPFEEATRIGEADIVVGIPFYNEANTIGYVVEAAKAAEKAGKSDWEIKDLYRKTGRKT